jgi:hypothetical protein
MMFASIELKFLKKLGLCRQHFNDGVLKVEIFEQSKYEKSLKT